MSKNKYDDQEVVADPIITHYLERYGSSASLGMLHPKFKVFSDSSIDGIIGYRLEHNCAVSLGDPLCSSYDKIALAGAFNDFCKHKKIKTIYAMTAQTFTNDALNSLDASAWLIGHDIILDPTIDATALSGYRASQLRQKLRNALANGLSAQEYKEVDPIKEEILKNIAKTWLSRRNGLQSFIQPLDIFAYRSTKRWFYAQKDSKVIGLLMLSKLHAYDGWVLNNGIMLMPDAPPSTTEFLVLYALETLRNEGCTYFCTGTTLGSAIGQVEGFNWLSRKIAIHGTKSILKILKLNDRQRFWNKFEPRKEPSFMTFTSSHITLRQALAVLKTFNVGLKKR